MLTAADAYKRYLSTAHAMMCSAGPTMSRDIAHAVSSARSLAYKGPLTMLHYPLLFNELQRNARCAQHAQHALMQMVLPCSLGEQQYVRLHSSDLSVWSRPLYCQGLVCPIPTNS